MDVNNGEPSKGVPDMEHSNWRSLLPAEIRQKCIHTIMQRAMRRTLSPRPNVENIVFRFEQKVYSTATSQSDYMQKINSKVHLMDSALQNFAANSRLDSSSNGAGPADQGSTQTRVPNVVDQNSTFTNTSFGVSQNPVGPLIRQCRPSNNFPNSQRHVKENRHPQQQVLPQQPQMQNLRQGHVTHSRMQNEAQRWQQQRHLLLGQSHCSSTHAQPLDQQSHRSSTHAQALDRQSHRLRTHSQPLDQRTKGSRLIGLQCGSSSMGSDKNRLHMQTNLGQMSQQQQAEQQLRSPVQSQPATLQPYMNCSIPDMHQRYQTSGSSFQAQHAPKQQLPQFQSTVQVQSSNSLTTERRQENVDDWQEEFYRVMKAIRDRYFRDLNEALRKVEIRHRQLASVQPKTEDHHKVSSQLGIARKLMQILQLPKDKIPPCLKGKLDILKRSMTCLLNLYNSSQQKEQICEGDVPNTKPQTQSHQVPQMNPHFKAINLNRSTQENTEISLQHEPIVSSEGTTMHQNIHLQQQKEHQMKQQNLQIKATNGVSVRGSVLSKNQNVGQSLANNERPRIREVGSSQLPSWTDRKHLQSPLSKPTTPIQNMGLSSGVVLTTGEVAGATPLVITSQGISPFNFLSPCDDREPDDMENPLQHLLRVVGSMSSNALSAYLGEMESVVNLVEGAAGSAPGNGCQSLVGEDLAASTSRSLEGGDFTWGGMFSGKRKLRHFITTEPSETTATSSCKRFRIEADHSLTEEVKEINQRLIDTVVDIISDEGGTSMAYSSLTEVRKGTIVECIFHASTVSPNINVHLSSAKLIPLEPLRLLVPANYPCCSPILLDNLSAETSMDNEDLSVKAKSKLRLYIWGFEQPMSVRDIARAWDICARAAICEYAEQKGGGSFTSKYGTWETL